MFKSLRFMNAEKTIINAVREDGSEIVIEPAQVDMWSLAMGKKLGKISAYTPPPKPKMTIADVKRHAAKRILTIASPAKQRILIMDAILLQAKGEKSWSTDDRAAWNYATALMKQIQGIRDASYVIERGKTIPDDLANDPRWP